MSLNPHYLAGLGFLAACLFVGSQAGPQATVGGQTLPSPDYMPDEIQYFPAGVEFLLADFKRTSEEYKAAHKGEDAKPYNPTP